MVNEFKEYGIAVSERMITESDTRGIDLTKVARGYTYTTRDDGFPPTNLIYDNPYADDIISAKNILDFGCGVGRNLPWIADNTDAMYYGLDPNPVMLDSFWKVTDEKYTDRTVLLESFEDIPEGMIFDVVVSTYVMQHLAYEKTPEGAMNPTDMTQEIMKHTREGTIWYLLEHEKEHGWLKRWFGDCNITPDVFIKNYDGQPDLTHRGKDSHLVIFKEIK